jgi:alpha-glucosidase
VFRFTRTHGGTRLLICLNFDGEPRELELSGDEAEGSILLSTHLDRESECVRERVALRANEGVVIKLGRSAFRLR